MGALASEFDASFVAATLTPFTSDGRVELSAMGAYVSRVVSAGADAVAVAVHTGRGEHLSVHDRAELVATAAAAGVPVVVGLTVPGLGRATAAYDCAASTLVEQARRCADAGARAALVAPLPRSYGTDRIVGAHRRVHDESGLDVIAFVLYEAAGGHQYAADLVDRLLDTAGVVGVKIALLDDAVGCYDLITRCRRDYPEHVVFTGEDRMLPASLMWGAQSCLVGLGAAATHLGVQVLRSWHAGDYAEFIASARRLDEFAALTFRRPFEGYVQRMAWVAQLQHYLASDVAHDPARPRGVADEHDEFVTAVEPIVRPTTVGP